MEKTIEPQPVLTPLTEAAIFLVATVHPNAEHPNAEHPNAEHPNAEQPGADDKVRDLLADVQGITRSVGFRIPDGELICVAGIGAHLWHRCFGAPQPKGLHPFRELFGPKHHAPSTPGDLLFHIRARRMDLCFELATHLTMRMQGWAEVVDEVHGFKYFDERDLLGFVDGTENPTGRSAYDAAIIGDEDPDFTGGSYVIIQKYLHDMGAWHALTVEDQERAIGRTKLADMEMSDDLKPANSHIALNVIEDDDGNELKIVRDNMPFGRTGAAEYGTYFIGYAATPAITERMLTNMFIGDPPGNTDRILDFSTAVTGCLFFVPSMTFLDDL